MSFIKTIFALHGNNIDVIMHEKEHYFFQYQIIKAINLSKKTTLLPQILQEYPLSEQITLSLNQSQVVQQHFQGINQQTPKILSKRQVYELLFRTNKSLGKLFKDAIYDYFENQSNQSNQIEAQNEQINVQQNKIINWVSHQVQQEEKSTISLCYSEQRDKYYLLSSLNKLIDRRCRQNGLTLIITHDIGNGINYRKAFKERVQFQRNTCYFSYDREQEEQLIDLFNQVFNQRLE